MVILEARGCQFGKFIMNFKNLQCDVIENFFWRIKDIAEKTVYPR